jgi:hypothetical protein
MELAVSRSMVPLSDAAYQNGANYWTALAAIRRGALTGEQREALPGRRARRWFVDPVDLGRWLLRQEQRLTTLRRETAPV